jgi:hypothetical protein
VSGYSTFAVRNRSSSEMNLNECWYPVHSTMASTSRAVPSAKCAVLPSTLESSGTSSMPAGHGKPIGAVR